MIRLRVIFLLSAVLLLFAGPALAQVNLHDASGELNSLLGMVRRSANDWTGRLRGGAQYLFWALALIQLVWTFIWLLMKQADFGEIMVEVLRYIMIIGFFSSMMIFSVEWGNAIVETFRQAGANAAGVGVPLMAGDVFAVGVELAKTVGSISTMNPAVAVQVGLSVIVILLSFTFIAAFIVLTLIESYIIINVSVFFVAFGGSQWTRDYALVILRYSVAVGAKLFILTLLIGLVLDVSRQWQLGYTHGDASTLTICGLALVCAIFCKTIPDLIGSLISGVSPGGGGAIGGMTAAGMAFGAAAMASLQSSGILGGAGSAFKGVGDLLKGSSGPSGAPGMSSGMNGPSGGGGGGNSPSSPRSSRTGGGIGSGLGQQPAPAPGSKAAEGSAASSVGGASRSGGGFNASSAAHTVADVGLRSMGVATSISMPGADAAQGLSAGLPPPMPDFGSGEDVEGVAPENIIRPASVGEVDPSPVVDTMSGLKETLNNRGNGK